MDSRSLSQNRWIKTAKLLFVIAFLPFLVSFSSAFLREVFSLSSRNRFFFFWGVGGYLLFHIFVYEPVKFYRRTQKMIEFVFSIFSPVFKASYYIIPFFVLWLLLLYFILVAWLKMHAVIPAFFFLAGLIFSFHLVMVAKIMKTDKVGKIIDYLFLISWVIIINIFFLSFILELYPDKFSFASVVQNGVYNGALFFKHIFRQLFVPAVK